MQTQNHLQKSDKVYFTKKKTETKFKLGKINVATRLRTECPSKRCRTWFGTIHNHSSRPEVEFQPRFIKKLSKMELQWEGIIEIRAQRTNPEICASLTVHIVQASTVFLNSWAEILGCNGVIERGHAVLIGLSRLDSEQAGPLTNHLWKCTSL